MMEGYTPVLSTIGGVLISFATIALLYFNGRIAFNGRISGIMGGLLRPQQGDTLWRAVFLAGLMTGAALILLPQPAAMDLRFDVSNSTIILGGFLVGIGTRIGTGCTSGHGVCGVGRLAPRSLVASAVFVGFAITTATTVRHVWEGF
ncbi:putative transporter component [Thiorhodovibrio winogradskyi]|uniref:Transporter component n=1 Tax=Thiorhodovibrio winogradskyi TaxID=77007 RepID=A0ABZ0SBS7_9GAMM|nr:YeeE/YedE thiosulfate transporter family protein [Thiorhodovibrio winogradskyi]